MQWRAAPSYNAISIRVPRDRRSGLLGGLLVVGCRHCFKDPAMFFWGAGKVRPWPPMCAGHWMHTDTPTTDPPSGESSAVGLRKQFGNPLKRSVNVTACAVDERQILGVLRCETAVGVGGDSAREHHTQFAQATVACPLTMQIS